MDATRQVANRPICKRGGPRRRKRSEPGWEAGQPLRVIPAGYGRGPRRHYPGQALHNANTPWGKVGGRARGNECSTGRGGFRERDVTLRNSRLASGGGVLFLLR